MMPILHRPGEMTPGQFGPTSRVLEFFSAAATRTISSTGTPSAMQITSGSAASMRFQNPVRRVGRRNENRSVRARLADGLGHRVENRNAEMFRSALARRDARYNFRCRNPASVARGSFLRGR
jgi:hypothetical protein